MINTVVINARIITMDRGNPRAEGIAISDGRIVETGSNERVAKLADEGTEIIDLGGATVTPGLIDTHVHVASLGSIGAGAGLGFVGTPNAIDIGRAETLEDVVEAIASRARAISPGEWVLTSWPSALPAGETLTRHHLDKAAPNVPVMVTGYPYVVVNSYLLALAGIGPETIAPRGGEILKDERGNLTGALAFQAVYQLLPPPPQPSVEETESAIVRVQTAFLKEGITAYRDVGLRDPAIHAYYNLRKSGGVRCRTELTYTWLWSLREAEIVAKFMVPRSDEWLGLRSVKLSLDGGITSRTAWSWNDWYSDMITPIGDCKGYSKIEPGEFASMIDVLHRAGLQVCCHCEGDRAIDTYLDAIERAVAATPTLDARHSVIHCNLPSEEAIRRMQRLGQNIVVETQSVWLQESARAASCGPDRSLRLIPTKTMLRSGITVGNGCDFPPHDFPPKNGLWSACTRRAADERFGESPFGTDECLTFEEALSTYTTNAARCLFWENQIGSIEPGKLADFVVWDRPIDQMPTNELRDASVKKTFVSGNSVYG